MTFLAPAFLAGLLAVALPLWLHRLSSTNPNRRVFSSLMFLEAGEPRRVLAKKLQYLLLLALRIAALVLLALVFAQPAWWRSPEAASGEDGELHVLVLDASASMAHEDRWRRASEAVDEILGGLSGEDRVQVVAAGRIAEVVAQATDDLEVARQAVATVEPTAFRVGYGQLMRSLDGVLRAADMPVVLHVVTDAQQSAMPTRFGELAPDRPAAVNLHDVSNEADRNWALESFGGSALTGELEAQVRGFADEPAERSVRLELNGETVAEQTVTIEPGGRASVAFDALDLGPGANRVVASLEPGDALAADDRRYLSLRRPEPRGVLIVSPGARGDAGLFVRAALETVGTLALETRTIPVGALEDETLADYDIVILTDAGVLGPTDAERMREYVDGGGGVLAALGPRSSGLGSLPVTGHAVDPAAASMASGSSGSAVSISRVETSHPALRGLEGLRSGRFARYVGVEPAEGDSVLLELDTGAPLLLEQEIGAGSAFVYTSTLDREWNNLPVQPVFVPLLAGAANHLLGGSGFSSEAELGSTLSVRLLGVQGGQIFDPDGEPALGLGGGTSEVVLERVGFYEVVGGGRTEVVAVNADPRESNLARVEDGTLGRWEGLGFESDAAAPEAAEAGEPVTVPFGQWLLWVLIAALLMESVVGNWHLRVRRGIAT